eukprot:scaffold60026_cov55-Phaeocystis_antarctica.AAC.2
MILVASSRPPPAKSCRAASKPSEIEVWPCAVIWSIPALITAVLYDHGTRVVASVAKDTTEKRPASSPRKYSFTWVGSSSGSGSGSGSSTGSGSGSGSGPGSGSRFHRGVTDQLLGEGLEPVVPLHDIAHRSALIEHQSEVNRRRTGRLGRGCLPVRKRRAALAHRQIVASVRRGGESHANVRVVEERGARDVIRRVVAPLRPVAAADNADRPAMQSSRGAALRLGELFICPRVPEQLKAVKKNGAALIVDAKAHPHAGAMRDSVLPRQLGPSAGRAVGPPVVAAAVFGAGPPVLGQVGAHNHSTADCRALCATGTAECTEAECVARSRLHAVLASRQARPGELRLELGADEAHRVRTIQRGCGDDTKGAAVACGAGAGRGGARAAARDRASVRKEGGEHAALHEAVGDQKGRGGTAWAAVAATAAMVAAAGSAAAAALASSAAARAVAAARARVAAARATVARATGWAAAARARARAVVGWAAKGSAVAARAAAARAAAARATAAMRAAPFPHAGEFSRSSLRTLRVRSRAQQHGAPPRSQASQYEHGAPQAHQWMAATWAGQVLLAPTLSRRRRSSARRGRRAT